MVAAPKPFSESAELLRAAADGPGHLLPLARWCQHWRLLLKPAASFSPSAGCSTNLCSLQVILTPAVPVAVAVSVAPCRVFSFPGALCHPTLDTILHFQYGPGPAALAVEATAVLGLSASRVFGLLIPFHFQKDFRLLNVFQASLYWEL